MLKEELLGAYEVRKTWAQKSAFIEWALAYAQELGVSAHVQQSGKLVRSRNIVFGDLKKARVLVTAHYDTCARLPFPNLITPCSLPCFLLTQGLMVLAFLLLGSAAGFCMGRLMRWLAVSPAFAALLSSLCVAGLCFLVVGLMLCGPANPHTANDNTSGVALVMMAMERLRGHEDFAFVLFDNEEKGLLGSAAFAKQNPELASRAFVIQYDCIGDGATLMYAGSKKGMCSPEGKRMCRALEEEAKKSGRPFVTGSAPRVIYPSDQMSFAKGTAFAALKGKRLLYLDRIHTAEDTVFDEENLEILLEVLETFSAG